MFARKGRAKLGRDLVIIEPFDRGDPRAIAGDRIGDAGTRRHVVEQQRARAAHAVLAAEMGAGQIETVAQEIGEMGARLDRSLDGARVDDERDRGHADASLIARRSTATWMCRSAAFAMPAFDQHCIGRPRIELLLEVARNSPAEQ